MRYDDFTKPLPRDQMRTVSAKVVTQPIDRKADGVASAQSFTLVPVRSGRYLEAKIGKTALPAALQARVKFQADQPEHVFDFAFDRYSKEPIVSPSALTTASAASAPSSGSPAAMAQPASATAPADPTSADPLRIGIGSLRR
jgi:hypothetical protein